MLTELKEIASQYSSKEEFKAKNYPKYLIAQRKGFLTTLYYKEKPRPKQCLYFIYSHKKIVFVGKSISIDKDLKEFKAKYEDKFVWHNARIYEVTSKSDLEVLYTYTLVKYKPYLNDVPVDHLSIRIALYPEHLHDVLIIKKEDV